MRQQGRVTVVVGGQYGSEAKGHVAARFAKEDAANKAMHAAVRVAGPNAGHTAYDATGHRFAFRQIPVAAVVNPEALLVIAAGSEIEIAVLRHEVEQAERLGHEVRSRLYIDPQATVITEHHKGQEAFGEMQKRLGSTQKGIGAARADRIMRTASLAGEQPNATELAGLGWLQPTGPLLRSALENGFHVLIEGTQGYGLGLHAGHYPKCTSSDCRAVDFLSMAGVSPWNYPLSVIVVCRVYPIRVAGDSGPMLDETTWEELGLPPEHTTVTKKVRRVGAWDAELVREAVAANGGAPVVRLALMMADQKYPAVKGLDGALDEEKIAILKESGLSEFLDEVVVSSQANVVAVGTGPNTMILAND